jgi:hypothetical protein
MVEDLTPEHLKCTISTSCPSVHRIVIDGKRHLLIVGRLVNSEEVSQELWESFGPDEALIAIEEDLLSGVGCQAEVTAVGERSSPSALQPTDSAEAWHPMETAPKPLVDHWADAPLILARSGLSKWHDSVLVRWEHRDQLWISSGRGGFRDKDLHGWVPVPGQNYERPIDEAGTADERTAETADASLTPKICNCHLHSHQVCDICAGGMSPQITPIDIDGIIAEGLKNPEYATQYVAALDEEIARLREENEKLRAALKPFAAIEPSSFYPADGSEAEPYAVVLQEGGIHELSARVEFTGADLSRARAALASPDLTGDIAA